MHKFLMCEDEKISSFIHAVCLRFTFKIASVYIYKLLKLNRARSFGLSFGSRGYAPTFVTPALWTHVLRGSLSEASVIGRGTMQMCRCYCRIDQASHVASRPRVTRTVRSRHLRPAHTASKTLSPYDITLAPSPTLWRKTSPRRRIFIISQRPTLSISIDKKRLQCPIIKAAANEHMFFYSSNRPSTLTSARVLVIYIYGVGATDQGN